MIGPDAPCPWCQRKQTFRTRTVARKTARRLYPGQRMSAYHCPTGEGWHIGHVPDALRRGTITRAQIRPKRGRET